jgi:hypothetical protein
VCARARAFYVLGVRVRVQVVRGTVNVCFARVPSPACGHEAARAPVHSQNTPPGPKGSCTRSDYRSRLGRDSDLNSLLDSRRARLACGISSAAHDSDGDSELEAGTVTRGPKLWTNGFSRTQLKMEPNA